MSNSILTNKNFEFNNLLNNTEEKPKESENLDTKQLSPQKTEDNKEKEIWVNSIKADGGAYKGCPKNDYCQHFVDSRERPQNFIRDYEEEKRFSDYPKLNELIKRKNEVLQKRATPAQYLKCDLKNFDLSTVGKYDVILIDPPIPEYQRRLENLHSNNTENEIWSFDEISNLRIDSISDQCCFLFMWVGSSEGLDKGRQLLKKWNFRRCEDIVWIKTNRHNFNNRKFVNDKDTLITHTKEHCLVGIKGAVKRGVDGHFIHANIDTDVIVSEEPEFGSTEKPQELYRMIERFCLGRKRIELFGEDHNIRPGWVTLGKSLSSSNLDIDAYNSYFQGELCYPEVQGFQGGRYVGCTQEIESLRPRSPMRNFGNSIINPLSNNMGMVHTHNNSNSNNSTNYSNSSNTNFNYNGYSNNNYHNNNMNNNMNWRNNMNQNFNNNIQFSNSSSQGHNMLSNNMNSNNNNNFGFNNNNSNGNNFMNSGQRNSGNFNSNNNNNFNNNNNMRFNNNNNHNNNILKQIFFNNNQNRLNGNSNSNFNNNNINLIRNNNNNMFNNNNNNQQFISNKNNMMMKNNMNNFNNFNQANMNNNNQNPNQGFMKNNSMMNTGQGKNYGNMNGTGNIYNENSNMNGNGNNGINGNSTNVNNLNNSMNSNINYMQNS